MRITHFLLLIVFSISLMSNAQSDAFKDYKVVYSQSFSKEKSTNDFDFSDVSKWLISKNGKPGKSLKCLGSGSYKGAHDGPSVVAVLKDFELSDFVVEMDVVQNGKDFSLLDFCIFFGIKDTENYCYAQVASKADKKSHNIFMVKGDKPKRAGDINAKGVIWQMKEWQHIRLERTSSDNSVKVYFNDKLVLQCKDEAFDAGHIGFGSSNSAIKIDNLKVSAPAFEQNTKTFF
ncbi:family 16 glycoside hydrolase [Carboxylicivirga marina]|uniref:family 16 glycoside hydrolase n=1 Tax=Carboxylicivirga marina TaxID=2800988 RepID=UPI0025975715|nr:family 16 glycoside hydrolase [uncultured Carboxylicivirga sp.]